MWTWRKIGASVSGFAARKSAHFLLILGFLQICGDILSLPALKAIGAATVASPAPRIFTSVKGLETFSTEFYVEFTDRNGMEQSVEITPRLYSRIKGPYNRRNVYGAVLAFGPILSTSPQTRQMYESVASFALCDNAPLLKELGIDSTEISGDLRIRLHPVSTSRTGDLPLVFYPQCR